MSFCNLLGYIWQSLCLDDVNSNGYAKFYQNIPKGSRDRASFTFFQNLNLGKTSTNLKCHLTISRATSCQYQCVCKSFITIFHSVQEKGPFSFFQNLELGKTSTDENDISQSLGLDLVNINVYAEVYKNIPLSSRDKAIFTFSEFGARHRLKWWWMSFCISLTFFFSRIWTSAKTQPISNVIWQSHGVHLVNINVYAKFHRNIPLSSRDSAIITFSEFGARQILDQWNMSFRNLLG